MGLIVLSSNFYWLFQRAGIMIFISCFILVVFCFSYLAVAFMITIFIGVLFTTWQWHVRIAGGAFFFFFVGWYGYGDFCRLGWGWGGSVLCEKRGLQVYCGGWCLKIGIEVVEVFGWILGFLFRWWFLFDVGGIIFLGDVLIWRFGRRGFDYWENEIMRIRELC